MDRSCWSQYQLAFAQILALVDDDKRPPTLENVIELVRATVIVNPLLLSRLEAVDVSEHALPIE